MAILKKILSLVFILLLLFSQYSQQSVSSNDNYVKLSVYYGISNHSFYNLVETIFRQFYIKSESTTPLNGLYLVHNNLEGTSFKAYEMNIYKPQSLGSNGLYTGIWELTLVWYSILAKPYDLGEKFYFYGKIGSEKYVEDNNKQYFPLKTKNQAILGNDYKVKIIEGELTNSYYSTTVNGQMLIKNNDAKSLKGAINFSYYVNDNMKSETINAVKSKDFSSGDELWTFSFTIDAYVSEISKVSVKAYDTKSYPDDNFGNYYKISKQNGLES